MISRKVITYLALMQITALVYAILSAGVSARMIERFQAEKNSDLYVRVPLMPLYFREYGILLSIFIIGWIIGMYFVNRSNMSFRMRTLTIVGSGLGLFILFAYLGFHYSPLGSIIF